FLLLGGRAADLFGRRRLLVTGLAVFSAASLLGGLAQSPLWLIGARALQGLGAALLAPAMLALITTSFAEGRARNNPLGVVRAVASAGAAVGVVIGGLLTTGAGWRWVMFINAPLGALVIALAPLLLAESAAPSRERYLDVAGAGVVTGGLITLIYAVAQGN